MHMCRIILSLRSYRHDPTATRPRIYSSFIQVYGYLLTSGAMPPFVWGCAPFLSKIVPPFSLSCGFIISEFRMSATAACFGCALSRVFCIHSRPGPPLRGRAPSMLVVSFGTWHSTSPCLSRRLLKSYDFTVTVTVPHISFQLLRPHRLAPLASQLMVLVESTTHRAAPGGSHLRPLHCLASSSSAPSPQRTVAVACRGIEFQRSAHVRFGESIVILSVQSAEATSFATTLLRSALRA